jgi:hypothetical protein
LHLIQPEGLHLTNCNPKGCTFNVRLRRTHLTNCRFAPYTARKTVGFTFGLRLRRSTFYTHLKINYNKNNYIYKFIIINHVSVSYCLFYGDNAFYVCCVCENACFYHHVLQKHQLQHQALRLVTNHL